MRSKLFKKFTASDKERQLEEALTLGNPITDLPLALEIDYFRIARDKYFIPISVKIPGSAIDLSKTLFNRLRFYRPDSRRQRQTGDWRPRWNHHEVEGRVMRLSWRKQAASIRHRSCGCSRRLPADIPSTRKSDRQRWGLSRASSMYRTWVSRLRSLRLSSVVWSNQREPLSASVGSAGTSKKLLAMHPLVQDGQKLIPSITRVFRKEQKMYVYFEVYDPVTESDQKLSSVAADLTMYSGSKKAFESSPIRMTRTPTNRPNTVAFQFELPLANTATGTLHGASERDRRVGKKVRLRARAVCHSVT